MFWISGNVYSESQTGTVDDAGQQGVGRCHIRRESQGTYMTYASSKCKYIRLAIPYMHQKEVGLQSLELQPADYQPDALTTDLLRAGASAIFL